MLILTKERKNSCQTRRICEGSFGRRDVSPTDVNASNPLFDCNLPKSASFCPRFFSISTQSAIVSARPTYYACRHGSQLKPFLPNVCPRAMRRSHSMQTLFMCTRGTLAARRHHALLRCAAIALSSRPRWRLKAKMCTARYDFCPSELCFVHELI